MTVKDGVQKLEAELWESADNLRANSSLTSAEYCMPVLGLLFLRYAYGRFRKVEAEAAASHTLPNGRVIPVDRSDFERKSAIFLPKAAQYKTLLELPESEDLGKRLNAAMEAIEKECPTLAGALPKTYDKFPRDVLGGLLRSFDNQVLDDVGGDVIGRIYEYFLGHFAPSVATDDGVFFTPKSLVQMIVNVIEPQGGTLLDPACGSGGMFVQTGYFLEGEGKLPSRAITFYGQEKATYNAQLCRMNMAVHGLTAKIASGDDANTFYHDFFHLEGKCDYVMANPPFNCDSVKKKGAEDAGRLPFGIPGVNAKGEFSNGNYLWISYFYAFLNDHGRAGFVMASSATDSGRGDLEIRKNLIATGAVDVIIAVGTNFFYTKTLPCTLWFFDKNKPAARLDRTLFLDARNYSTAYDRTHNGWSEWQRKNILAAVWLMRGETGKYKKLLAEYTAAKKADKEEIARLIAEFSRKYDTRVNASPLFSAVAEALVKSVSEKDKAGQKAFLETLPGGALRFSDFKRRVTDEAKEIDDATAALALIEREEAFLKDCFGEGKYRDVKGFCRLATRKEIEGKGWSLTPGAYVGVKEEHEDQADFTARMKTLHAELHSLQADSVKLAATIDKNFKELGL